jgi:hypothetical protein
MILASSAVTAGFGLVGWTVDTSASPPFIIFVVWVRGKSACGEKKKELMEEMPWSSNRDFTGGDVAQPKKLARVDMVFLFSLPPSPPSSFTSWLPPLLPPRPRRASRLSEGRCVASLTCLARAPPPISIGKKHFFAHKMYGFFS